MNESAIIVRNAHLVNLDPLQARIGELRIVNGHVTATDSAVSREQGDEVIDAGGAVVMPGMVNGHTHLYSALAAGMPAPPKTPTNFHEILRYIWWRLDRALDLPLVELSATIGALDALHCGTTTLIDHHASPEAIDGSLDAIEVGLKNIGLRGVLCYETTDRNGLAGRDAGLRENERYLKACQSSRARSASEGFARRRSSGQPLACASGSNDHDSSTMFAALAGAHAAFTMSDDSLAACVDIAKRFNTGVHIHVAEDACDARICRDEFNTDLLDRLGRAGILGLPSILGHCIHLTEADLQRVNASGVTTAHNTRSNMNNAVGYAPLARIQRPVQLGTDGIGSDMFAEVQTAWFKTRDNSADAGPGRDNSVGMTDCVQMLANAARRASQSLGVTLGKLEPGAAADIVITDYVPATPLTSENVAGHLVFAMSSRHVRHVMVGGQWRLRDRAVIGVDEARIRREAIGESERLWSRLAEIPCV